MKVNGEKIGIERVCNCGINCKCAQIQDFELMNFDNLGYDPISDFIEK